MRRHIILVGSIVVVVLLFAGLRFCQPERQVLRHSAKLLAAVESKDWKELSALMADDYSDRWVHDKPTIIEWTRAVSSQFLVMELNVQDPVVEEANGLGRVRARVKLEGNGGPLAMFAVQKVGTLQQPFVFEWRQASWKPWHWVLVRVDQPELEFSIF